MYPEHLTKSIREELTLHGFQDITTAEQVETLFDTQEKTILLVINSVCGCGASVARPAVLKALKDTDKKPDICATIFAGVDMEATEKAREFLKPYPSSSPCMVLLKNKNILNFVERHHIEGNSIEQISQHLDALFQNHC